MAAQSPTAGQVTYQVSGISPGTPFSQPLAIFFDSVHRETYIADTGNHQIVVCDEDGMPLFWFYHYVNRDTERFAGEPRGLVVDDGGRIFLVDNLAPYIDVLDGRGREIGRVDPPAYSDVPQSRFGAVALGPDGLVYGALFGIPRRVAVIDDDLGIARVVELASDDEEAYVTGLAVDNEGHIYVTDPAAKKMVQIFDSEGHLLRAFGGSEHGFENFSFPSAITLMPDGDMWVVDTLRQIASRFTAEGNFISYVGGKGNGVGAFEYPTGIATDGGDKLFVIERGGNRYQCFDIASLEDM